MSLKFLGSKKRQRVYPVPPTCDELERKVFGYNCNNNQYKSMSSDEDDDDEANQNKLSCFSKIQSTSLDSANSDVLMSSLMSNKPIKVAINLKIAKKVRFNP